MVAPDPAELRSTLQGWIRAVDSKFKICYKALTNFRICYTALKNIYVKYPKMSNDTCVLKRCLEVMLVWESTRLFPLLLSEICL